MQFSQRIPIISLFCGCGGLDLGFNREGFETLLAIDINGTAVDSYNCNQGEGIAQVADLTKLDGNEIRALLQAKRPGMVPRGVIGGPPCQHFSNGNVTNNHQSGLRRELPARYALILKELNAAFDLDFFVFENVRGITFAKHRQDLERFKGLFEDAGFNVFEDLLDAQYYGVAQKRPRLS